MIGGSMVALITPMTDDGSIDEEALEAYQAKGYLFERAKGFSSKEVEIAEILTRAKDLGLDFTLLDDYVEDAKVLAKKENDVGSSLLNEEMQTHNARYELLFDLILKLKPYIFNMHTVQAHQSKMNKD